MTIREVYYRILDKCNKLSSNAAQDVPMHIFVQNFNEAQLHWSSNCLKVKERNSTEIRKIQQLLVTGHLLNKPTKKSYYYEYTLPENYFDHSASFTNIADCPYKLENNLVETHNILKYLRDPDWSPSIRFEETLITIAGNKMQVYFNNEFTPKDIDLIYYRFPKPVNMADGFADFNNKATVDIDPEWDGDNLEEIIDLTVELISGNYSDQQRNTSINNHIKETQVRI